MRTRSLFFLWLLLPLLACADNWDDYWGFYMRNSSYEEIDYHYDFEIDRLRYTILSKEDRTVSVRATCYNCEYDDHGMVAVSIITDTTLTGNLEIPSQVVYRDTAYTVTAIDDNAFSVSRITSVVLPPSIETIGQFAFVDSRLQSVSCMGNQLQTIKDSFDEEDFENLGKDVPDIIRNCYCYSETPSSAAIYLRDAMLHVPVGCKEAYQQAEGWKQYGENIVDDINLEGIHHAQLKTQDSDAPTYDLQGRRVAHPKQGEIYIQNGRKIRK